MNTDPPAKNIYTGQPEYLTPGGMVPPEVPRPDAPACSGSTRPRASIARRILRILRVWPRVLGAWAVIHDRLLFHARIQIARV
jgi:hypothetical protein